MKVNKIFIMIVAFGCLVFSGCVGNPIHLGMVDQRVDHATIDFTKGRNLSASAGGFQLLLLIPISINNRHERAFQQLRGQAGSDYITDIKIQESWTWGFVGTAYRTTITAKAYPRK